MLALPVVVGQIASDLAKQKLPISANLATTIFVEKRAEYMGFCSCITHKNWLKQIVFNKKIGAFSQNG